VKPVYYALHRFPDFRRFILGELYRTQDLTPREIAYDQVYPVEFAVPPELIIRETTASPNPKRLAPRSGLFHLRLKTLPGTKCYLSAARLKFPRKRMSAEELPIKMAKSPGSARQSCLFTSK
jgi:hypothetical protein